MSLIQNIRYYPSRKSPARSVLLLCGFGGAIWQTRLLIARLNRAGYDVTAMDFSKKVLSAGDPRLLPTLVNEVVEIAEEKARQSSDEILLVGISLGSLLCLNIMRRSDMFKKAVMITGGNIVTVAQNIFGRKVWPQKYEELAHLWQEVNIWTEADKLKGKSMLFVLPTRDKLIDTTEVRNEIKKQQKAKNSLQLVERKNFGHVGTIVEETILFPGRVIRYIRMF